MLTREQLVNDLKAVLPPKELIEMAAREEQSIKLQIFLDLSTVEALISFLEHPHGAN